MTRGDGRREYGRVDDRFNVRLVKSVAGSMRGLLEIDTSKSINISGSGMLVSLDRRLEVGDTVTVTFMKPHTFDLFHGAGRVIRVEEENARSYRVGIQFIGISAEDSDTLDYYLTLGSTETMH